jgi:hypothetical protein
MMILWTINIILFLFLILLLVIVRNLYIQNSKYEFHVEELTNGFFSILDNTRKRISQTLQHMRDIDNKEMFEKDDDVGVVFQELTKTIETLNNELKIYDEETEKN